jgi:hypothetical protein
VRLSAESRYARLEMKIRRRVTDGIWGFGGRKPAAEIGAVFRGGDKEAAPTALRHLNFKKLLF